MLDRLQRLEDPELDDASKRTLLEQILEELASKTDDPVLGPSVAEFRELSLEALTTGEIDPLRVKYGLVHAYQNCAKALLDAALETEELEELFRSCAEGYQRLAEGLDCNDQDTFYRGLEILAAVEAESRQIVTELEPPEQPLEADGPPTASQLLESAYQNLLDGREDWDELSALLETMQQSLRRSEQKAGITEDMWEDQDPLVQGMALYLQCVELGWCVVREEEPLEALDDALDLLRQAERLLQTVAEETEPEDTPIV